MALFGEEEGDVGPFVMGEDGEEWFPFTLDNLEMDRGCDTPLQQDPSIPMEQEAVEYGQTDEDDDVDAVSPAGASGPGPPDKTPCVGGGFGVQARAREAGGNAVGGGAPKQQQQQNSTGLRGSVPQPKARPVKVKAEAKEMRSSPQQKRPSAEAAEAKRSSRGGRYDAKIKHRAAGGMAGGVGGMPGRSEAAAWSSKDRAGGGTGGGGKTMTTMNSASGSGGGGTTKVATVQNRRRLERNAREQKRSLKISQRIEDLRRMLSQFGVDVKASKSAVLSEATDYIAHLQRQHVQSEAERARILQLLHTATRGAGAAVASGPGPVQGATVSAQHPGGATAAASAAAAAVTATVTPTPPSQGRTAKPPPSGAQQRTLPFSALTAAGAGTPGEGRPTASATAAPGAVNGFGGYGAVEPLSESWMLDDSGPPTTAPPGLGVPGQRGGGGGSAGLLLPTGGVIPMAMPPAAMAAMPLAGLVPVPGGGGGAATLEASARGLLHVNYERVFRSSAVPMAVANVSGNLVECNARLTQATGFRREEALFMTIFDLVADPFLQHTFSMISCILKLREPNLPYFQVVGKRRDGSPGGVVQISVVQDDALRPLYFCICIVEGGDTAAVAAAVGGAGGIPACPGAGDFWTARGVKATAGGGNSGNGGNGIPAGCSSGIGGVVRITGNVSGP